MTNTYKDDATIEVKKLEELRCLRCVLERILRVMDEGLFVDYEMEKFGKSRDLPSHAKHNDCPCSDYDSKFYNHPRPQWCIDRGYRECREPPPAEEPLPDFMNDTEAVAQFQEPPEPDAVGGMCPHCDVLMESDYHFQRPDGMETTWYECPQCRRQYDFLSGVYIGRLRFPAEGPEGGVEEIGGCPYTKHGGWRHG